jgi:tetratricopeptide (TPR) repeat protein
VNDFPLPLAAELGLGLAEEAADKFTRALKIGGPSTLPIAAYGQGAALLSLAQRDAQDGKAGSAHAYIRRALEGFESSTSAFGCTQKLLGDLYSFGAALPPDVFAEASSESAILDQIVFVRKGEDCYRSAVEYSEKVSDDDEEAGLLRAALVTDTGANLLLQAQLTAFHQCKGMSYFSMEGKENFPDIKELFDRAVVEFRRALQASPLYSSAWCGLGCAMVSNDPLLAQHAFCRSIQLDNLSPDAYSNLGFLYTAHDSYALSKGVLDALTQVADSPMMWINRALILERNAAGDIEKGDHNKAEDAIAQAADAYRAALQVVKHPSAMLGLALTSRVTSSSGADEKKTIEALDSYQARSAFQESYGYLLEHSGTTGGNNASAGVLEGLWNMERGAHSGGTGGDELVDTGKILVKEKLESLAVLYQEFPGCVDGKSGRLDIDLINKCLAGDAMSSEEVKTSKTPVAMTLARHIVHEPHRGDLWVDLAKVLSKEVSGSDKNKAAFESARLAASRAVNILTNQLTHPHHIGSQKTPWVVEQKALSEAHSLLYWLEHMELMSTKKKNDSGEDGVASPNTLDLQRALMICPNNKFAREALACSIIDE